MPPLPGRLECGWRGCEEAGLAGPDYPTVRLGPAGRVVRGTRLTSGSKHKHPRSEECMTKPIPSLA